MLRSILIHVPLSFTLIFLIWSLLGFELTPREFTALTLKANLGLKKIKNTFFYFDFKMISFTFSTTTTGESETVKRCHDILIENIYANDIVINNFYPGLFFLYFRLFNSQQ